jgi:hypothetical protein
MAPPLSQTLLTAISKTLNGYCGVTSLLSLRPHKTAIQELISDIAKGEVDGPLVDSRVPVNLTYVANRIQTLRQQTQDDEVIQTYFTSVEKVVFDILKNADASLFPQADTYLLQSGYMSSSSQEVRASSNTKAFLDALAFIQQPGQKSHLLQVMLENPHKLYRLIVDEPWTTLPLLQQEFGYSGFGRMLDAAVDDRSVTALLNFLQHMDSEIDKTPYLIANLDDSDNHSSLMSSVLYLNSLPNVETSLGFVNTLDDFNRTRVLLGGSLVDRVYTLLRNGQKEEMLCNYFHAVLSLPESEAVNTALQELIRHLCNNGLNSPRFEDNQKLAAQFVRILLSYSDKTCVSQVLCLAAPSHPEDSVIASLARNYPDLLEQVLTETLTWPEAEQHRVMAQVYRYASCNEHSAARVVNFVLNAGERQSALLALSGVDNWNILHLAAQKYPQKGRELLEVTQKKFPYAFAGLMSATTRGDNFNPLMWSITCNASSALLFLQATLTLPKDQSLRIMSEVGQNKESPLTLCREHGQKKTTGKLITSALKSTLFGKSLDIHEGQQGLSCGSSRDMGMS